MTKLTIVLSGLSIVFSLWAIYTARQARFMAMTNLENIQRERRYQSLEKRLEQPSTQARRAPQCVIYKDDITHHVGPFVFSAEQGTEVCMECWQPIKEESS